MWPYSIPKKQDHSSLATYANDWEAITRREGYSAASRVRFVAIHLLQFYARQDFCDYDFHLIGCERGAEASAGAAAEGEEGVRGLAGFEESVGIELVGEWPEFGASVRQVDAWRDRHARW